MQQQEVQQKPSEPAQKMYVFGQGRDSLHATRKALYRQAEMGAVEWQGYAARITQAIESAGCLLIGWLYLAWLVCMLISVLVYLFLVVVTVVLFLGGFLLLSIGAGACLLLIGLLRSCHWLYTKAFTITYDCPNPHCYNREPLPIFICPVCQRQHRQLHPNAYGIWTHRCHCTTKLHTMERAGRYKLARYCPGCNNRLDHGIGEGTNIHLPLIGGPSAGKTLYMTSALNSLITTYNSTQQYHFSFLNRLQEANFTTTVQRLQHGQTPPKTPEDVPLAYTVKMDVPRGLVPKILYLYDAGGEAYNANERTDLQTYYKYVRGLIFIIDPCAITRFRHQHAQQINALTTSLRPCTSEIMQVHDRMMRMLEKSQGVRKRTRYPFPIAVVVTKVDALALEYTIGAQAARYLMSKDPTYTTEGDAIHDLVQVFLRNYGLSDLLRNLEYHFSHVRYFSCSSLGRLPSEINTSAFVPLRTLDPFLWLLSQGGIIKQAQREH